MADGCDLERWDANLFRRDHEQRTRSRAFASGSKVVRDAALSAATLNVIFTGIALTAPTYTIYYSVET